MNSKNKKLFLILSVVVPFLIYCVVYYTPIIRNAAYQEKDFVSLEYQWGDGDKYANAYNSATGDFHYLNKQDSLVNLNIKLNTRDVKYLDSIADVQGFWNLPNVIANSENDLKNKSLLRYKIMFNYRKKSKEVIYYPSFAGNEKMKLAAGAVQKEIEKILIDKESNLNK